jgi:hypothetical protein
MALQYAQHPGLPARCELGPLAIRLAFRPPAAIISMNPTKPQHAKIC